MEHALTNVGHQMLLGFLFHQLTGLWSLLASNHTNTKWFKSLKRQIHQRDYSFVIWFCQINWKILVRIFFSDEVSLNLNGTVNTRNCYYYAEENEHHKFGGTDYEIRTIFFSSLQMDMIRRAFKSFVKRSKLCVEHNEEHFESFI